MDAPIVIIGAGQGGLQAAESLRTAKFEGEILLLGDESHAPYNRPPLSKAFLLGDCTQEQLVIRQPNVFEKKKITLRTGISIQSIAPKDHLVICDNGEKIPYGKLIIATGSCPIRPPIKNVNAKAVHCVRTLNDTLAIKDEMATCDNIVVIGGGFIGLEMAAVARKLNKNVHVIEFAERLMARVVSPMISDDYKKLHEDKGVAVHLNAQAQEIKTDKGRACAVVLKDGREIKADLVILGTGVSPNETLAKNANIECDRGIIIDAKGQTSDQDIYAIGDCCAQRLDNGELRRLESVQNAVELAKAAAASIMGVEKPFIAAPWFWSDQYDIKLQMVGLSAGYDQFAIRGEQNSQSFSYLYFKNEKLIAIDSLNQSSDHMAGRKLLGSANNLTPEQAIDINFKLKDALL